MKPDRRTTTSPTRINRLILLMRKQNLRFENRMALGRVTMGREPARSLLTAPYLIVTATNWMDCPISPQWPQLQNQFLRPRSWTFPKGTIRGGQWLTRFSTPMAPHHHIQDLAATFRKLHNSTKPNPAMAHHTTLQPQRAQADLPNLRPSCVLLLVLQTRRRPQDLAEQQARRKLIQFSVNRLHLRVPRVTASLDSHQRP